jgi:eukaryotic-like serine/threonine-protein kinase
VSTSPLEPGDAIAPAYGVVRHLNRGKAIDVYEVWSDERCCSCVAKVLRPDRRSDKRSRQRLREEGRLLLSLSHPHIVRAYELRERPHPVVVLETLPGETLAHMIESRGRLRVADVAWLGVHLCSAIGYLHRRDILHLDVKPSNVVSENGQAKLLDLSVARPPGPARRLVGTRPYMAPEQAARRVLTTATDVWGIGATLYEAATGSRVQAAPRDNRRRAGVLGRALDACLAGDPAERASIPELASMLEAVAPTD